jgi:putative ABC transport system permease protein
MGPYLTIAFRNLKQAKRRTLLLTTALVLVTTLLMLGLSLSKALSETMIRNATALASGHVNVAGFYKNKPKDAWPMVSGIGEIRRIAEENTKDLDYVVVRTRAWAKIISHHHSMFCSPSGIDYKNEPRLPEVIELAEERAYKEGGEDVIKGDLSRLAQPHTALIFASQAKRLRVEIGDYLTITAATGSGRTNTLDVTVVAIAKDFGMMSNWNIFVPSSDVKELYQTNEDSASAVMIYLKDHRRAEETMGHLRQVYLEHGYQLMDHDPNPFFMKFEIVAGEDWTGQKLDLTTWTDEVSYLSWITDALDSISFALVGILMVIIAVGIMNSMWISVRERTREVGMIRAMGMTRGRVLLLFLSEALLLGLFATTIGALLGGGIAVALNSAKLPISNDAVSAILMSDTLHLSVSLSQGISVIVIFTLVTTISALWPASRAARLQPVIAIGHTD